MPQGHTWAEYCALPEEERFSVVEIDCVEGAGTDTQVLLTMLFKRISFLLVFVLEEHTQECVREAIDSLQTLLEKRFRSVFPLLLTDCDHEFQNWSAIEKDGRTKLYYCEPATRGGMRRTENDPEAFAFSLAGALTKACSCMPSDRRTADGRRGKKVIDGVSHARKRPLTRDFVRSL